MVRVLKDFKMVIVISENSNKEKPTAKAYIHGVMEKYMMANGKMG